MILRALFRQNCAVIIYRLHHCVIRALAIYSELASAQRKGQGEFMDIYSPGKKKFDSVPGTSARR